MKKPSRKKFFSKKKKPNPPSFPKTQNQENLRLNKFMAHCGIDNRRACEVLIQKGLVTVNDEIVTESAYRVKKEDVVKYDGKVLKLPQQHIYILLNKPKGYIPSFEAIEGEKTFKNVFGEKIKTPIVPLNILAKESAGLQLFSDDELLIKKINQPTQQLKFIYHLILSQSISNEDLQKIQSGIKSNSINISSISHVKDKSQEEVGVEVKGGSDQDVKNTFEQNGIEVKKIDRVFFAGLTKKDLPRGRFRFLTEKEVIFLKHF